MTEQPPQAEASKDRFRKLLEKIDPEIRIARLREEKKQLEQRFMETYSEAELQDRLAEANAAVLEAEPDDAQLKADTEQSQYFAASRWRACNVIADELESITAELESIGKVGTRSERRRRTREGPAN